ncbi:MAG: hypothetical protein ACO1TE_06535 [Prosthecobacter sp.]
MNEPGVLLKGQGTHRPEACSPWPGPKLRGSLVAALCLIIAPVHSHGAGPFATRERLHKPQGPLAEKALAELADKAEERQRVLLDTHMTFILEEMKGPLKISEKETLALVDAVDGVIDVAVQSWKQCVAAGLRPILVKYGDDAGQASRISTWTAGQLVPDYVVEKWTPPEWLPQWDKAVETHLGAVRAAQWRTLREDRRKAALPAIEQFLQRWADTGRKSMDDTLAEHLRLMEKSAPLGREEAEKLSTRLRKLVDDHVAAEKEAGREMVMSMPDEPRKEFLLRKTMGSRFIRPTDEELEEAWTNLAGEVAGDAALQAWKAAVKQKKQDLATRHGEVLKPSRERARTQMEDQMAQEVEALVAALNLPAERRKKIEDLSKKAVAESLDTAAKVWLKSIESWTEESLQSRKNVYFSVNATDQPARRAPWQEGLKALLSAEELRLVQQSTADRKTRATFALARAALADADQLLSLTAEQRRALEPLVAPQLNSLIREENARSWRVEAVQLLMTARNAPEKQVRAILDEVQMQKWLRLGQARQEQLRAAVAVIPPAAAAARRGRTPTELDLEVEAAVSTHMHQRSVKQRAENLQLMLAQVEDAHRTLSLEPERRARLTLAAKGAVEADMIVWRQNVESWTRGQLNFDAPPEAVKVMLANLEASSSFSFAMINTGGPSQQAVWQRTVKTVLSEQERAAWDKVVAERKAYRVSALAGMAVFELDRRRRLAPQQCAKLEKILAAVVEDYLPEIESSMSSSRAWSWHLSYYSCLMPLAGAKKADLQAVLTPAQWKLVKDQDMADAERYWSSIESRRKMRQQIERGNVIMPAPLFFFNP